ncbi:MAG TPA: CapA family protein [Armatimonadota bacterium]
MRVRNASWLNVSGPDGESYRPEPVGCAQPDADGDFLYEPVRGGGRVDKMPVPGPLRRARYIEASRFGEVNTYYHLDLIAGYMDGLLHELGMPSLPPIVAVVNAHHAATETDLVRDGVLKSKGWLPFQGGHYRLPSRTFDIQEYEPVSPDGEIHLGPGWQLWTHGALPDCAGTAYRANASHNAGILYHEYGHHLTRHTADFRANSLRAPDNQNNRKSAMDEGTCDYWAAVMLQTPHIWAWHRRHDEQEVHARSLVSSATMADFDASPTADAHANGTIWGTALWDFRTAVALAEAGDGRRADRLVLQALHLMGRWYGEKERATVKGVCRARQEFATGLAALLQADNDLYGGAYRDSLLSAFARRGITPDPGWNAPARDVLLRARLHASEEGGQPESAVSPIDKLRKHVPADEIPCDGDLLSAEGLADRLARWEDPPLSLLAGGDVMLGGRAKSVLQTGGFDHPFAAVLPLLRRSPVVLANLEGPLARKAQKQSRNYSYKANPRSGSALARAGINVVTVANNHLTDCGREGILETLDALESAGVAPLGGGRDAEAAHLPVVMDSGDITIGLLGYYWNRRCAAIGDLPGGAMDTPESLEDDIRRLRGRVDRVVVAFHWGVPYEREPLAEDRAKAQFVIDCGADAVIGCHPHVLQPFEVYRDRPIFYSVGNFAFGSGNSKGEGLLVGLRFDPTSTTVSVYPLYVKNRDPRVDYQPKVLTGAGAESVLRRLKGISGTAGQMLNIEGGRGVLRLPFDTAITKEASVNAA